jgi:hypothetical protein
MKKLTAFQSETLLKVARAKGQRLTPYGLQIRTCKSLERLGLVFRLCDTRREFDGVQITDAGRKAAEDLIRAMGATE